MGTISIILLIVFGCNTDEDSLDEYLSLMNNWEQFDAKISTLENADRDLLLLRLAVQQPRYSTILCRRVQSQNAKEKCKQVIGRPHLTTPRSK
jgi:hypothetical protein